MRRRLFLAAASISSFFSNVTFTFGMPRPDDLLMKRTTFTFSLCSSMMAASISSSSALVSTSFTTTLRESSTLASADFFGGLKIAEVPTRPLSSLFRDSYIFLESSSVSGKMSRSFAIVLLVSITLMFICLVHLMNVRWFVE